MSSGAFIPFPPNHIASYTGRLQPGTPAAWGAMTAQHMLEHLLLVMQLSRGKYPVEIVTPEDKIEKVKRIVLHSDAHLKRDFAAPFLGPGLQPLVYPSLEKAEHALLDETDTFLAFWEANPDAVFAHPVFGRLNRDEWYLFHRKHFTHHFTQFGLL